MSEHLLNLLLQELREAVAARVAHDTGPDEMTAALARRLSRIKQMQEDAARPHPGPTPGGA